MKTSKTFHSLSFLGFLALGAFLSFGCNPNTQITGVIYDEAQQPLKGISLSLDDAGSKVVVTTNEKGEFSVKGVNFGEHMLYLHGKEGVGNVKFALDSEKKDLSLTYPVITKVILLHTNDAHGSIDNFPKLAWAIKEERKNNKNVFVLNAGDNFSGNPFVDQHPQKGLPMIELWNEIGLDVMTLGNHEFDYGQEVLNQRLSQAKYKVVSANINTNDAVLKAIPAFTTLVTDNQLKLDVLGLIDTSGAGGLPRAHPKNLVGLQFQDPVVTVDTYAKKLGDANARILLSHIGTDVDEQVAAKTQGLDVIVGGHSHTQIDKPYLLNNVLIAQAKDKAKMLGKIVLTFKNEKLVDRSGELIAIKNITNVDPKVKEMVDGYNNNPALNVEIANSLADLVGKDELGSFINDATRARLNLDIVFCNNGGLRVDRLNAGAVKLKDIYGILPFSNEIILLKMTPAEIRSLLKYSVEKNRDSQGIDLQVSGMTYVVTAKSYTEVTKIDLFNENGEALDENKTYSVGVNSYVVSAYQFTHADPGVSTYVADNESVIDYLKQLNGPIPSYTGTVRAKFVLVP